jgi:hypothetical protein
MGTVPNLAQRRGQRGRNAHVTHRSAAPVFDGVCCATQWQAECTTHRRAARPQSRAWGWSAGQSAAGWAAVALAATAPSDRATVCARRTRACRCAAAGPTGACCRVHPLNSVLTLLRVAIAIAIAIAFACTHCGTNHSEAQPVSATARTVAHSHGRTVRSGTESTEGLAYTVVD